MSPGMDAKQQALSSQGALNPHPQTVIDLLFKQHAFFDARDLVQVKYEMLRRVRVEGHAAAVAARQFGFSRQGFYQVRAAFNAQGLAGLIRKKPGPRRAHKLSESVMQFVHQQRAQDSRISVRTLVQRVQQHFGFLVHPRSIERALQRHAKKGQ